MFADQPAVAIEATASLPAPFALFQAACIDGEATIPAGAAEPVSFDSLPDGAKRVLRFALSLGSENSPGSPVLAKDQVAKTVYKISGKDESYLLLPDGGSDTSFRNLCAVVVRGQHFTLAKGLVLDSDAPLPRIPGQPDPIPYVSTYLGGYRISAAEHDGWSMASTVPSSQENYLK